MKHLVSKMEVREEAVLLSWQGGSALIRMDENRYQAEKLAELHACGLATVSLETSDGKPVAVDWKTVYAQ